MNLENKVELIRYEPDIHPKDKLKQGKNCYHTEFDSSYSITNLYN